jgi:hypothetical protein
MFVKALGKVWRAGQVWRIDTAGRFDPRLAG